MKIEKKYNIEEEKKKRKAQKRKADYLRFQALEPCEPIDPDLLYDEFEWADLPGWK